MIVDLKDFTLGKRLKLLRDKNDWTQQEAADICGICLKSYSNWEKERNKPSKRSREILAKVFNVKEEKLFGGC